ncbi:WD repeat-containing protein 97 isoform X2 [Notolabrus celidotus]|uniref:WD repeat-containing protein 97 isoform X2 n=1 Tax=Notolabrus celidotus TaxID=1203425 RepID=UPI0014905CC9|nr:WD repeat-containing protein 97 isoform X2 [Notolabrus celidotus]
MATLSEDTRTTTVVLPGPSKVLQFRVYRTSNGEQKLLKQDVKEATGKVTKIKRKHRVFTHGLHRLQHFSCDSPVRFMMFSEAAASYISLHTDNSVCLYTADGLEQTSSARLTFTGLTETKILGHVVGWGPGPVFTLMDSMLRPLEAAHDALDIRVCQAAEHSAELVTAGAGNVCVWSVMLMRCKVKIEEGLQHRTFTILALAPPKFERPHMAFVACRQSVTVVDLDGGKVLEHKKDLCSRSITAMVFCSLLDCLITASQEPSIKIWGPKWEQRVSFEGFNGVVNSLFYCPALSMLLSATGDGTICCWNVEEGDAVECVHTEQKSPLMFIGGNRKGDTFFSFSHHGIDFWSSRNLYTLFCPLKGDIGAPLRQILVTSFPAPFPIRVLCISGDSDVMLVAAETGVVLTSFKAKQRVLCANYCLQKEILLALTESGTVLQANTLTNPVTLMQEWKERGQGSWQHNDNMTESEARNLPTPGPACCLVLYCYVTETQDALEEWKSLQDRRGCSERNKRALDDAKNLFLIILGQSGGCLSVLRLKDGKVLYRTPAHNGQRVTALHVCHENGYLLSTGEDMTLVLWKVNPFIQKSLSQQMILHCGQPQACMAALGPQLAFTFQDLSSGTHKLMHFNLLNQSRTDDPPTEGHLDHITGLCVCPHLDVFVSSSLDRTVCVWNEENQLISTLRLNAAPQCLAYSGFGGELFLGIRGDLYKMDCAEFLPQMLLDTYRVKRVPDFPVIENKEKCSKRKNPSADKDEDEELQAISSSLLPTEDMWRQKERESLVLLNKDLSALLEGSVKCRKAKPPSTKETRKEAFDQYMKIIYKLPLDIKIDLDDTFNPNKLPFYPKPHDFKPCTPCTPTEDTRPKSRINKPLKVEKERNVPEPKPKPKTPKSVKQCTVRQVTPKNLIIMGKQEEQEEDIIPPEVIPPADLPKPKTPAQCFRRPKTRTPPPPAPEGQAFLKQFAGLDWFKDLFPDKKCIPSNLSPEDFSLQLLGSLKTCSAPSRIKILAALQALHSQGLFHNTDKLYQGLIDLIPKFVRPNMLTMEKTALAELLNLLVHLKSVNGDIVKQILTLLAFKKRGLRETALDMLTSLGVNEAEQWLLPELETWDSELQDQSKNWKNLHDRADCWLELWISKYKEHDRFLYLRSTAKWKPPTFSVVDVLNYFCSVQKEEYRKARCEVPAGPKNAVLLPLDDCSQPVLRLGETHTGARIWRPQGLILPPLRNRPFLMHFPSFIPMPLPRVTLSPFHIYSDEDWVKASSRRYFIQQESYVDYYR